MSGIIQTALNRVGGFAQQAFDVADVQARAEEAQRRLEEMHRKTRTELRAAKDLASSRKKGWDLAKTKISALTKELAEVRAYSVSMETTLEMMEAALEEDRAKLVEAHETIQDLHIDQSTIDGLKDAIVKLREDLKASESKRATLRRKLTECDEKLRQSEEHVARQNSALEQMHEDLVQARSEASKGQDVHAQALQLRASVISLACALGLHVSDPDDPQNDAYGGDEDSEEADVISGFLWVQSGHMIARPATSTQSMILWMLMRQIDEEDGTFYTIAQIQSYLAERGPRPTTNNMKESIHRLYRKTDLLERQKVGKLGAYGYRIKSSVTWSYNSASQHMFVLVDPEGPGAVPFVDKLPEQCTLDTSESESAEKQSLTDLEARILKYVNENGPTGVSELARVLKEPVLQVSASAQSLLRGRMVRIDTRNGSRTVQPLRPTSHSDASKILEAMTKRRAGTKHYASTLARKASLPEGVVSRVLCSFAKDGRLTQHPNGAFSMSASQRCALGLGGK